MKFTTFDQDNDQYNGEPGYDKNCAISLSGGT